MRKSLLITAILGAFAAPSLSYADEAPAAEAAAAPAPTWTFPGSISFVSDYIWHGQTQTWSKPAVQAGIEVDHASGFYAGFWGSNVSSHWLPNANLETDWTVGFRNSFATDFKYDVGAMYVYYPSADFSKAPVFAYDKSKLNTVELYASLGWKWFTVKGGYNPTKFYGWNTNNSGVSAANPPNGQSFAGDAAAGIDVNGSTRGSGYIMASASYDVMEGLNVAGEVGRQMIADSTHLDWTWYKLGVTKALPNGFAVNVFYTGTTGTDAYKNFASFDKSSDTKTIDKSKLVIGVSKSF
jgi:uncharacterized protein (TIGR02001 family)